MNLKFLKGFVASIAILVFSIPAIAQKLQYKMEDNKEKISLIITHKKTKLTKSEVENARRGHPLPEAYLYPLDIKMDTVGTHSTLPTGENIWKLVINVPDAKGFFVGLDDFYLPKGAELFVYRENDFRNAVVFMNEDNPKGGPYSIEDLSGDNVVLEYVSSPGINEKPRIHLKDIGYKYATGTSDLTYFNQAENACMININCPKGYYWQNQKKGIVQMRTRTSNGTYRCSGSLINNSGKDKTPYLLTAAHCFEKATQAEAEATDYIFEYEAPGCEIERPTYKFHRGSQLLVNSPLEGGSDGSLLKLTPNIPDDWDVYYNGWNRENETTDMSDGAVIHHPLGDVKKISFYNKYLLSGNWEDERLNPDAAHWIAYYSEGVTEGGSSGSPLFDKNGLIVGTLSGGDSKCTKPNGEDYYGKMWYHWDKGSNTSWHMKSYLDPANTGATKLEGLSNLDGEKPAQPSEKPEFRTYFEDQNLTIASKDRIKKITISDLSGQVAYRKDKNLDTTEATINTYGWGRGVYVIIISTENRSNKSIKIFKP
ncbi:MAG: trypsin-like peptidase domain-containing protein [Dysgonomonas sp.]|nr:trypsin-like peptidase domain-containing protein [Dysgonomonas sp.]